MICFVMYDVLHTKKQLPNNIIIMPLIQIYDVTLPFHYSYVIIYHVGVCDVEVPTIG